MNRFPRSAFTFLILCAFFSMIAIGCDNGVAQRAAVERGKAQVQRIADELDKKTTDTGVYIRAIAGDIKERDPWGTQLDVSYSQGGVAEQLTVRLPGPDRQPNTPDDVVASRMATNVKGIGEGIKQNVEETATNAAKGLVKGTIEGVKESVADAFRSNEKKAKDSTPDAAEVDQTAPTDADK